MLSDVLVSASMAVSAAGINDAEQKLINELKGTALFGMSAV